MKTARGLLERDGVESRDGTTTAVEIVKRTHVLGLATATNREGDEEIREAVVFTPAHTMFHEISGFAANRSALKYERSVCKTPSLDVYPRYLRTCTLRRGVFVREHPGRRRLCLICLGRDDTYVWR